MIRDARELAERHPVPLAAVGNLYAEHLFASEREADVVEHRRDVIAAVDVGINLSPGSPLAHLFESAVEIADLNVDFHDALARELHHTADGSVHRGMRRSYVEEHRLDRELDFGCVQILVQWLHLLLVSSSLSNPGRARGPELR